jgi:hypothetical protein
MFSRVALRRLGRASLLVYFLRDPHDPSAARAIRRLYTLGAVGALLGASDRFSDASVQ